MGMGWLWVRKVTAQGGTDGIRQERAIRHP